MNPLLKNPILRKIIRFFRPADSNANAVTDMYSRFEAIAAEQELEQKELSEKAAKLQKRADHAESERSKANLAATNIQRMLTKEED
ncbi:hypothetical protein VPHD51_0112 [Vibrio phage D51]